MRNRRSEFIVTLLCGWGYGAVLIVGTLIVRPDVWRFEGVLWYWPVFVGSLLTALGILVSIRSSDPLIVLSTLLVCVLAGFIARLLTGFALALPDLFASSQNWIPGILSSLIGLIFVSLVFPAAAISGAALTVAAVTTLSIFQKESKVENILAMGAIGAGGGIVAITFVGSHWDYGAFSLVACTLSFVWLASISGTFCAMYLLRRREMPAHKARKKDEQEQSRLKE